MQDINAPRVIFCLPRGLDGVADSSVDYLLDLRTMDLLGLCVGLYSMNSSVFMFRLCCAYMLLASLFSLRSQCH